MFGLHWYKWLQFVHLQRVKALNRQFNSYDHAEDYVEEISHKLFCYPELFVNLSVTFILYFCVYFGYFSCTYCGLYLLAGAIMYLG